MAPFRLQGKHLFLTYPQCSLELEYIYDHLLTLPIGNLLPDKLCVAQETHEDGNLHYHCYLYYPSKRNITDPSIYDIDGHHPNMQSCRSPKSVLKYVTKDGIYKANFIVVKPSIKHLISHAADEKDFVNQILEHYSTKAAGSFNNYLAAYRYLNPSSLVFDPLFDFSTFKINDVNLLAHMVGITTHVKDGRRTKSLWLHGPSRTGKTSLARSIGRHCYIGGGWNFDNLSDEAQYVVIDDLPWERWQHNYKQILGCQIDITFSGKYRAAKTFKWNIPAIICTNTLPIFTVEELDWLHINCTFINIINRLY